MNATKRKFNALLNSIGSRPPSNSSKEDSACQSDSNLSQRKDQPKKRRVSDLITELNKSNRKPPRSDTSLYQKDSLVSVNLKGSSSSLKKSEDASNEPAKYAPWDRDNFLRRLKSFSSISDWTPKPAAVNEVEWAKRGWVCQKFERVRCCSCDVEIVVKLNRKEVDGKEEPVYVAHAIDELLVEKYVKLIITSHRENCLWRIRGCDNTIFKLPLNHPHTTIINLKDRFNEIKSSYQNLPYTHNLRFPDEFDLRDALNCLRNDFFLPNTSISEPIISDANKVAFALALFGWQGHHHERFGIQINSISCQACFRVLGLWMFKSKKVDKSGMELTGAAMNCLDVVGEHRLYCPWRNAASQNGVIDKELSPELLPGWKIVLQVVKSDSTLQNHINSSSNNPRKYFHNRASATKPGSMDGKINRDEKDREMRSRIMRVRSLFDPRMVRRGSRKMATKLDVDVKQTSNKVA